MLSTIKGERRNYKREIHRYFATKARP